MCNGQNMHRIKEASILLLFIKLSVNASILRIKRHIKTGGGMCPPFFYLCAHKFTIHLHVLYLVCTHFVAVCPSFETLDPHLSMDIYI